MTIQYNHTFRELLTEFDLQDLLFSVDLPPEVQNILKSKILISPLGISLKSFRSKLYKGNYTWENQSVVEDNQNHFHVDWYIDPPDNKKAFMLGVKTLMLLAEKFEKEKVNGVRFWLSFQTPELGEKWAKYHNLYADDDVHYISDRLSFYTRRDNEEIIEIDPSEKTFSAILIIDI